MEDNPNQGGTRAHTPDLDWSQVRETMLMLHLAAGQIESAMKDSNTSVDVLTESFTTMAGYLHTITNALESLPDEGEIGSTKNNLLGLAEHVTGMAQQSIIAFQFYDKLTQRLGHVCHGLAILSDLVGDKSRIFNPAEWVSLQQEIRSKYSTMEERAMFEAVMNGVPVQEALDQFIAEMRKKQKGNDVELF